MPSFLRCALVSAGVMCAAFVAPAHANVIYNLTFDNYGSTVEGTGVLTLNLPNLAAADNLNTSNTSIFGEVKTNGKIDNVSAFDLFAADLSNFYIQTSSTGGIYTLTVAENVPSSNYNYPPTNILILDLYTSTWQIHGQYDSTIDQGALILSGPSLAATPIPAALPLFAGGLGIVGFLSRRKKRLVRNK